MKASQYLFAVVSLCLGLLCGTATGATGDLAAAREIEAALHLKPDLENGREVYLKCVACHQPEGWGEADGSYPQIAGQLYSVIIKQMADIRARNRDTPIMLPFTMLENLSVQEIADVSAYISAMPMNPVCNAGPGNDLERGKILYQERCAECHGDVGQGKAKDQIPLIQGQHYSYLSRQFDWIRSGKRRNGDPKMVQGVEDLDPAQVSAVLDYVSRLRPAEEKLAKPGWRNPDYPQFARKTAEYPEDVCKINE